MGKKPENFLEHLGIKVPLKKYTKNIIYIHEEEEKYLSCSQFNFQTTRFFIVAKNWPEDQRIQERETNQNKLGDLIKSTYFKEDAKCLIEVITDEKKKKYVINMYYLP